MDEYTIQTVVKSSGIVNISSETDDRGKITTWRTAKVPSTYIPRDDPHLKLQLPDNLHTNLASAPRLVQQRPWYVLSCLWDGSYKRTLAFN